MKTAFITGVMGQDGTYLKEILLEKGYKVIGFDKFVYDNFDIEYKCVDLSDYKTVLFLIKKYKPQVIFNLAGVSDVFDPWNNISEIISSNVLIPKNFMQAIMYQNPEIVFCQASSCLVFGKTKTKIQSETTPREPIYPYGFSKNFIDGLIKEYREEKKLNFCSAIFYNHDSPKRGENFFIKKLINFAKKLQNKPDEKMVFNDIDVYKDIGYAKDYMKAFCLMGEASKQDDYIISSGKLINLKDIIKMVSNLSSIELLNHITINSKNTNHNNSILFGDNSKIQNDLGWKPDTSYEEVVKIIWKTTT